MKSVSSLIILLIFALIGRQSVGQISSSKLKKDQEKLEQQISATKSLLSKSQENTNLSLKELQLIENQIKYREQLLKNYDNQIQNADLTIEKKQLQIENLHKKIDTLKSQYKALLIYSYKHRNKYGQMMYIFSADNYYEALKRKKYLEKIAEIQQKQFIVIRQNQELIKKEIVMIEEEKSRKRLVMNQKIEEREEIRKDKVAQQEIYNKFKAHESELLAKLREEEKKRAELKNRIAKAIQREIAEAEERRRRAEEEARRRAEAARKESKEVEVNVKEFPEAKENALVSKNFEGNRGKLPWPVSNGSIIENYGKNPHPTLNNVFTNNRGIDIGSPKNAQVHAVFSGEVTSVINISGAGMVVIIKHGNYRTVYSNLKDTYVTKGMKVSTKMPIGSLLVKDGENMSELHFEIHKVEGSNVICLNPSLWVSR